MRNVSIKINEVSTGKSLKDSITEIESFLISSLASHIVSVSSRNKAKLQSYLESTYDCSVREGVTNGCYGSSTGEVTKGLTVYFHAKELVDRYVDVDYGEQVNPWDLFITYGVICENINAEGFAKIAEELGLSIKSDNTYNYATDFGGENSENAGFMFDFQFDVIENQNDSDASIIVCVMFHCGGDPRGNYTNKMAFKFDSIDELYSVLYPSKIETDAEAV